MKKIIAALLIVALLVVGVFALVACNKDEGKVLTVGVTDYEPYDFQDEDGNWTGFDAEVAKLVAKELGYDKVKFVEIDWDYKITELQSGKIDVIWNGMTMTDELAKEMNFSYAYATNYQVAVIKSEKAATLNSVQAIKDANAKITAESGSAGEDAAKEAFGESAVTGMTGQMLALNEVNMGTSDVAIVDYSIAKAKCGSGSFANLQIVDGITFSIEEFAIGFRKADTELRDNVNALLVKYYKDGTLDRLQQQFGAESIALSPELGNK